MRTSYQLNGLPVYMYDEVCQFRRRYRRTYHRRRRGCVLTFAGLLIM